MRSIFDIGPQQGDLDSKLVVALEKLSEVLRLLLWEQGKKWKLSPLQIQFLVFLRYHQPEQPQVTLLAERFNLTKATVSDAVTALENKGLVQRLPLPSDRRRAVLQLTPDGETVVGEIDGWAERLREHLKQFAQPEKESAFRLMLGLIAALEASGLIHMNRICLTCRYYQSEGKDGGERGAFCHLLQKPLQPADLRIDCPEHEPGE